MKTFLKVFLMLMMASFATPVFAQEADEEVESTPLRVTIRPMPKFRYGDFFSYGQSDPAPKLEELFLCPPDARFECEALLEQAQAEGDQFALRLNRVVSSFVYEKHKDDFGRPDLGLIMGGRYYGLPRYVILASFGIDPKLPEELWKMNGTAQGLYGDLEQQNMYSIGDRIGGPIILIRNMSQIDRLKKDDNWWGF